MKTIRHAVWPMPAPSTCTAFWDQSDWNRAAEFCRPAGYTGGIFDAAAYAQFAREQELLEIRRHYASYGLDMIANRMSAEKN